MNSFVKMEMNTGAALPLNATQCGFCPMVFQRKQDYYEHNNREHMDIICELWEGCPRCPKFYPTRIALNKHKIRYHSRRSIASAPSKPIITAPVAATSTQEDTPNSETCDFCLMFFAKKSQYYAHVNEVHQDLICYSWEPCQSCLKYFPTRRIRDRHRNGFRKRGEVCTPNESALAIPDSSSFGDNSFEIEESPFAGPHFMASLHAHDEEPLVDDDEIIELDDDPSELEPLNVNNSTLDKLTLTCQFCKLVLSRKQDYYEHANKEHLNEISQIWKGCSECVRFYPTRKSLNSHTEKSHRRKASATGEETNAGESCNFCHLYFTRRDQFYKHANDVHTDEICDTWTSCQDCGKYFPTKRICDRHRERLKSKGDSCVPKYATSSAQLNSVDPSFLSVEYEESNEALTFEDEQSMTTSSLSNISPGDKNYVTCNFCSLVLSRKQDFYDHANREHLETVARIWLGCRDCIRFYPTRKSLNNHEEKSHRQNVGGGNVEDPGLKGETCNFCPMVFSRREQYYRHVNDDHVDMISESWIPCVDCQKYFPSKRIHDRHREKFRARGESCVPRYANSDGSINFHSDDIQDKLDGQGIADEDELASVEALPVSDRQYITCCFCSLILQREQDYYDHANREHSQQLANFWQVCTECSRYYPTRKSLYKHKRKSHREKQRQLDQDPASLKGETCEFCSSIFTRKDLYYKHANDAHKDLIAEAWVSCSDCSKYFPTRWIRDRHREGFKTRGESCIPRYASATPILAAALQAPIGDDLDEDEFEMLEEVEEDDGEVEDPGSNLTECDFCESLFEAPNDYYSHANEEHLDLIQDSWVPCDICSKLFPSEESCIEHQSTNGCKMDLKARLKAPTVTISRIVKLEPRTNLASPSIRLPASSASSSSMSNPSMSNPKGNYKPGKLACSYCDQTFGKEQHYYRHVSDVHHEEASQTWVPCEGCYRLFPSRDVCYRHRKKAQLRGMPCNPEGMEFCEICNMSFVRKEAYYKHANDQHRDEISMTWVQCEECYKHYPSKAVLNSHKLWFKSVNRSCKKAGMIGFESQDNSEEPCPYCQISFPAGSGLLLHHINALHSMEEAGALEDEDQEPFHSELEFEENEWQEQSTSSKKTVDRGNYSLKRVKIKQEQKGKFPKFENSEVETLDDCLMEGNASLFARVKVANKTT